MGVRVRVRTEGVAGLVGCSGMEMGREGGEKTGSRQERRRVNHATGWGKSVQ